LKPMVELAKRLDACYGWQATIRSAPGPGHPSQQVTLSGTTELPVNNEES
jgi:hypothetical protein